MEALCKAGREMPVCVVRSYGLTHVLQHTAVTQVAGGPNSIGERSSQDSLSPSGRRSGSSAAEWGPTAMILKCPV